MGSGYRLVVLKQVAHFKAKKGSLPPLSPLLYATISAGRKEEAPGTAAPLLGVRTREIPRPVTVFLKGLHHNDEGSAL